MPGHKEIWYSHPRKFGAGSRQCRTCGNTSGIIRKYGIMMCRQCFRQYAKDIGFVKGPIIEAGAAGKPSKQTLSFFDNYTITTSPSA